MLYSRVEQVFLISLIALNAFNINAFFFFNQKKSSSNPADDVVYATLPVSKIRGVTQYDEGVYDISDNFQCKNGEKSINRSFVNDEFCDCSDGSDEPGTSACSFIPGPFYCINKGYKTIKIQSSRVDDGICDCCDGSDEGNVVKCQNTCDKVAAKERDMLEKSINVYKVGNRVLSDMETKVKRELLTKVEMKDAFQKEVDVLNSKLQSLRSQYEQQKSQLHEQIENVKVSAKEELVTILQPIREAPIHELANFLSNLFNILNMNEDNVTDYLGSNRHDRADRDSREEYDQPPHEDDPYHDHHYGDEEHQHHQEYDGNNHIQDSDSSSPHEDSGHVENPVEDISNCELYLHAMDSRLRPFCSSDDMHSKVMAFLTDRFLAKKKPFREMQLLLGYHERHKSFKDSEYFVQDMLQMSSDDGSVCPVGFESLSPSICLIQEKLQTLIDLLDKSIDNIGSSDYFLPLSKFYQETESQLREAEEKLSSAEEALNDAEKANEDLSNPHYAMFGYRGEKFSVKDGQYLYSVTVMETASQGDENGHSDVSLGHYDHVEETEDGNLIWKFTNGQYCYNFGARTADVHVTCGPENKLLSAREPSTCFYLLHAESPLACTTKYARAAGIELM